MALVGSEETRYCDGFEVVLFLYSVVLFLFADFTHFEFMSPPSCFRLSTGGPRQEFLALELIHMVRSSTEDAIYDRSVLMELFTTLACHLLSTPPQSPEHVDLVCAAM